MPVLKRADLRVLAIKENRGYKRLPDGPRGESRFEPAGEVVRTLDLGDVEGGAVQSDLSLVVAVPYDCPLQIGDTCMVEISYERDQES